MSGRDAVGPAFITFLLIVVAAAYAYLVNYLMVTIPTSGFNVIVMYGVTGLVIISLILEIIYAIIGVVGTLSIATDLGT